MKLLPPQQEPPLFMETLTPVTVPPKSREVPVTEVKVFIVEPSAGVDNEE